MKREEALKVTCPKCGAPPGAPCMGKKRARLACHVERFPGCWGPGRKAPEKRSRATRCNSRGCVYIVGNPDGALVKIGWTGRALEKRLAALQTANGEELVVLATIPGSQRDEQALHERFKECHVRGEWFRVDDELDAFIRQQGAELV